MISNVAFPWSLCQGKIGLSIENGGSRIQGSQEKLLSKAGKAILVKAVAQSITTYAMSCFDLTKGLCDELT